MRTIKLSVKWAAKGTKKRLNILKKGVIRKTDNTMAKSKDKMRKNSRQKNHIRDDFILVDRKPALSSNLYQGYPYINTNYGISYLLREVI